MSVSMHHIHLDTLSSVLQEMTALIAPTALVFASETFVSATTDRLARTTGHLRRLDARLATLNGSEPPSKLGNDVTQVPPSVG